LKPRDLPDAVVEMVERLPALAARQTSPLPWV
jgi:hypothetical protein